MLAYGCAVRLGYLTPTYSFIDNLQTPLTDLGDNRHENFKEYVDNEDDNDFPTNFPHAHFDPDVFLCII